MRPKAIKDLCQADDKSLFTEVAAGLSLVLANVGRLVKAAKVLSADDHFSGARLISAFAEEEATKVLILLDAVRCPRSPHARFSAQLGRFSEHLAKGLYAKACEMRPATLGELQSYLDHYRLEFYLDGPNDVDWIFHNDILRQREDAIYVDYVESDGRHYWSDPDQFEELSRFEPPLPDSVCLAEALAECGLTSVEGLEAVARIWRGTAVDSETPYGACRRLNIETLRAPEIASVVANASDAPVSMVANIWPFPLFDLDLTLKKVTQGELRDRQRAWSPNW